VPVPGLLPENAWDVSVVPDATGRVGEGRAVKAVTRYTSIRTPARLFDTAAEAMEDEDLLPRDIALAEERLPRLIAGGSWAGELLTADTAARLRTMFEEGLARDRAKWAEVQRERAATTPPSQAADGLVNPESPVQSLLWFFAFKANGDTPWEVTTGSAEEMAALYEHRRQNWTDVLLGPIERGPADLVGTERAGAAEPMGLRNTAIFLAKLWSDLDDLRYRVIAMSAEDCRETLIMQWPVLQGTRNQLQIRALAKLPAQPRSIAQEIRRAVEAA
jgi:hypothetical protein